MQSMRLTDLKIQLDGTVNAPTGFAGTLGAGGMLPVEQPVGPEPLTILMDTLRPSREAMVFVSRVLQHTAEIYMNRRGQPRVSMLEDFGTILLRLAKTIGEASDEHTGTQPLRALKVGGEGLKRMVLAAVMQRVEHSARQFNVRVSDWAETQLEADIRQAWDEVTLLTWP